MRTDSISKLPAFEASSTGGNLSSIRETVARQPAESTGDNNQEQGAKQS